LWYSGVSVERFLAAGIWENSLAMAARRMAVDRSIDGQSAVSFAKRLRSEIFTGELVSRLRSLLWNFRRWKEVVRGSFATRQEKAIAEKSLVSSPESTGDICPAPAWNRTPARVTFEQKNEAKFTYTVRSRAVDVVVEDDDQQASDE
jgi:hypothetical protein